ncbi:MAG: hypothetical protein R2690_21500 [Acidimicrobiales bacterium]|nr:hypothetical protein [Acidimicrobiaceae bacterium]
MSDERRLRCPKCGRREWLAAVADGRVTVLNRYVRGVALGEGGSRAFGDDGKSKTDLPGWVVLDRIICPDCKSSLYRHGATWTADGRRYDRLQKLSDGWRPGDAPLEVQLGLLDSIRDHLGRDTGIADI